MVATTARLPGVSNLTWAEGVVQAKDLKECRTHGLDYRKNCIAAEGGAVFIERCLLYVTPLYRGERLKDIAV